MLQVRPSGERGSFDFGWLKTQHSFSFSQYYDPKHMRFRMLRVINEDWVQPNAGFPTHAHDNMEIITYVISGTLEHADSLGSKGQIRAGEIQRMSAGSGIQHSEYNPDANVTCHLLQIWLIPNQKNVAPSWEQVEWKSRPVSKNGMRLLVSPDGRDGSARIHQDALLWHAHLATGSSAQLDVGDTRGGWLQMIRGKLTLADGTILLQGDGLAVDGAERLKVIATDESEYIWFDLP